MTYSEKLKDPRWLEFRDQFIKHRRFAVAASWCDDCGQDTHGSLHVHHRLYRPNAEPWDYEFNELRLLCEKCHSRIHATEQRVRALVRSLAAHECYECNDLLAELERANALGRAKSALALAKNAVRNVVYAAEESDLQKWL